MMSSKTRTIVPHANVANIRKNCDEDSAILSLDDFSEINFTQVNFLDETQDLFLSDCELELFLEDEKTSKQPQESNPKSKVSKEGENIDPNATGPLNCSGSLQKSPIENLNKSFTSLIREKLKRNSTRDSPHVVPNKRQSLMQQALDEAKGFQVEISTNDVGPFYGLPSRVRSLFKSFRSIGELYEWQDECLKLDVIKERRNLIYSLPTSGGKTLVAEILMFREMLCNFKDAVFVLPYVSLVQEKVRDLAPFAVELDFAVEEYAASKGGFPPRKKLRRHTMYICTIEKANMLVDSLIELKRLEEIGIVVADELHMVGEGGGRGADFESLLAKILYLSKYTQIIGMSATLSNMDDLKQFLHAEVYEKNFRPVELREYIKVGKQIFESVPKKENLPVFVRDLDFQYSADMLKKDPDFVAGLVTEVIPKHSCLVFCPTKKHCENIAGMLTQVLPAHIREHKEQQKVELYHVLVSEGDGKVCPILAKSIRYGIAYHHSGLTANERKLIEEAYIAGTLCCLACTSTLAAGVNLPAKRVILRAPYVARDFITFSRYKQMVGRAGRAGIDSSGESILMIKPGEVAKVQELLHSTADTCNSCLLREPAKLQMLLLTLIGLDIASTVQQIEVFVEHTLATVQSQDGRGDPTALFRNTVAQLLDWKLVKTDHGDEFHATNLGQAAYRAGVNPSDVEHLSDALRRGLEGLALNSYLHLLFIVTPDEFLDLVKFNGEICAQTYLALSAEDQAVTKVIGIEEGMVMVVASGRSLRKDRQHLLHRFYLTLILYEIWKECSIWDVSDKYNVHRGIIMNMVSSAAGLGSTIIYFCKELQEFWAYAQLFPPFVRRLNYCVTSELIPLMDLPAVKASRARQLYAAGFKTIADIAKADIKDMVNKVNFLPHYVAVQIISAAKMLIVERVDALKEEAEQLIGEDFQSSVLFVEEDEPIF